MLLSTGTDSSHVVRESALQLLSSKRECLHSRLLHRSTDRLLAERFLGSPDRHLHLALLRPLGQGRRDSPWRGQGPLKRTQKSKTKKAGAQRQPFLLRIQKLTTSVPQKGYRPVRVKMRSKG